MNEQTQKLIEQLAQKLGTTAEHLWGVLVRQAPVSGVTHIVCWIIAGVFFYVSFKRIKAGEDADAKVLLWALWSLGFLMFLPMFYQDSQLILASFFNPEFWALKQIIK